MCLLLGCRVDAVYLTHRCVCVCVKAPASHCRTWYAVVYGVLRTSQETTPCKACHWQLSRSGQVVRRCIEAFVYDTAKKVPSRSAWMLHKFTVYLSGNKHILRIYTLYPVPCTCIHAMQGHVTGHDPCTYVELSNVAWSKPDLECLHCILQALLHK